MRLQGSLREDIFNKFWDGSVVPLYEKIMKQFSSPAFFSGSNTLGDIERYVCSVRSLINNVARQCEQCDDKDYVDDYIRNTVAVAVNDLNKYKAHMGRFGKNTAIIDQYIAAIDALTPAVRRDSTAHFKDCS